jgi:integrase
MSLLRELIRSLDERARSFGLKAYPDEGFIFSPHDVGERPYHPDSVNARFRKLCKLAEVNISPHELRHYAATQVAPFLTETEMMGRFGWKTNSMVHRYADYLRKRDSEAGAAMDRALRLVIPIAEGSDGRGAAG